MRREIIKDVFTNQQYTYENHTNIVKLQDLCNENDSFAKLKTTTDHDSVKQHKIPEK